MRQNYAKCTAHMQSTHLLTVDEVVQKKLLYINEISLVCKFIHSFPNFCFFVENYFMFDVNINFKFCIFAKNCILQFVSHVESYHSCFRSRNT